jgi:hypothetical protein
MSASACRDGASEDEGQTGVRSGFVSPSRATGSGASAGFAGLASGQGLISRGVKRMCQGGQRSESVPPADASVLTLLPSRGAKGRDALPSQAPLGIVKSRQRVAALPPCGRRLEHFWAASGPTLGPTPVASHRVTTHHQRWQEDRRRASAAASARGPASRGDLRRSPRTASAGRCGLEATRDQLAFGVRQCRRHRRASRRARGRRGLC